MLLCEGSNCAIHLMGLSPVGDQLLHKVGVPCLTLRQIAIPAGVADDQI